MINFSPCFNSNIQDFHQISIYSYRSYSVIMFSRVSVGNVLCFFCFNYFYTTITLIVSVAPVMVLWAAFFWHPHCFLCHFRHNSVSSERSWIYLGAALLLWLCSVAASRYEHAARATQEFKPVYRQNKNVGSLGLLEAILYITWYKKEFWYHLSISPVKI